MTSTVTGKQQVTIPAEVARKLRIHRGSRVEWAVNTNRREAVLRVLPSRGELARSVWGLGRKYAKRGDDWVKALMQERAREDEERERCLEGRA